ncbi:MAG: hypothetical protein BroJett018_10180 [Chloroflexota bacterium]|nr:DUF4058 family protein [Chloroflexota bacterium]NOG62568.1 DUF4058 family protein [Chloroflexota bacterium]GIK63224.1 MAG: hypothetical protein BroJett018_10180 [Chloroflexota bacterium]
MSSPFPGFDPYIEQPAFWSNFHNRFGGLVCDLINEQLPTPYIAVINPRREIGFFAETTHAYYPDVGVFEQSRPHCSSIATSPSGITSPSLELTIPLREEITTVSVEIRYMDNEIPVTTIEILSPINKQPGNEAYQAYLTKRLDLLENRLNLIELDFLRAGQKLPTMQPLPPSHYTIFLHRAKRRPIAEIWLLSVRDTLPIIPVPLLDQDPDIRLDLGEVFQKTYEVALFGRRINYAKDPPGYFSAEDLAWVRERIHP